MTTPSAGIYVRCFRPLSLALALSILTPTLAWTTAKAALIDEGGAAAPHSPTYALPFQTLPADHLLANRRDILQRLQNGLTPDVVGEFIAMTQNRTRAGSVSPVYAPQHVAQQFYQAFRSGFREDGLTHPLPESFFTDPTIIPATFGPLALDADQRAQITPYYAALRLAGLLSDQTALNDICRIALLGDHLGGNLYARLGYNARGSNLDDLITWASVGAQIAKDYWGADETRLTYLRDLFMNPAWAVSYTDLFRYPAPIFDSPLNAAQANTLLTVTQNLGNALNNDMLLPLSARVSQGADHSTLDLPRPFVIASHSVTQALRAAFGETSEMRIDGVDPDSPEMLELLKKRFDTYDAFASQIMLEAPYRQALQNKLAELQAYRNFMVVLWHNLDVSALAYLTHAQNETKTYTGPDLNERRHRKLTFLSFVVPYLKMAQEWFEAEENKLPDNIFRIQLEAADQETTLTLVKQERTELLERLDALSAQRLHDVTKQAAEMTQLCIEQGKIIDELRSFQTLFPDKATLFGTRATLLSGALARLQGELNASASADR